MAKRRQDSERTRRRPQGESINFLLEPEWMALVDYVARFYGTTRSGVVRDLIHECMPDKAALVRTLEEKFHRIRPVLGQAPADGPAAPPAESNGEGEPAA
jgi:hypothetical protein